MRIEKLKKELSARGARTEAMVIGQQASTVDDDNKFCIWYNGREWEVFFFERGNKFELKKFSDEVRACKYFVSLIESDSGMWNCGDSEPVP